MELTGSGEPIVEKLRSLVGVQGELVQSHAARITASEAGLGPPTLRADDPETGAQEGDELRRSRAALVNRAAAAVAGRASSAWPAASGRRPKRLRSERPPRGLAVPGWSPSLTNPVGIARRGLATFAAGGGFVGSVSAPEHAPARPAPSRARTCMAAGWPRVGPPTSSAPFASTGTYTGS